MNLFLLGCTLAVSQAPTNPFLYQPSEDATYEWSRALAWAGTDDRGDPVWARAISDSYDDLGIAAALIVASVDDDGHHRFNELGDAALLSGVVTGALKYITGVPRPDGSASRDSFPSGHSSLAFCVATVLADEYPAAWPLWYAWAAGVAASRVALNRHRVIDVIAGAVVGTWAALTALDTDRSIMKHLTKEFEIGSVQLRFMPEVHPRGITILEARW